MAEALWKPNLQKEGSELWGSRGQMANTSRTSQSQAESIQSLYGNYSVYYPSS